jgi:hypothetical protein
MNQSQPFGLSQTEPTPGPISQHWSFQQHPEEFHRMQYTQYGTSSSHQQTEWAVTSSDKAHERTENASRDGHLQGKLQDGKSRAGQLM